MKKELLTRMKTYSIAAGAIAISGHLSAAIVYNDVDPDESMSGSSSFALDLNNDGTMDFNFSIIAGVYTFTTSFSSSSQIYNLYFKSDYKIAVIGAYGQNKVYASVKTYYYSASSYYSWLSGAALDQGQGINNGSNWFGNSWSTVFLGYSYSSFMSWTGPSSSYFSGIYTGGNFK